MKAAMKLIENGIGNQIKGYLDRARMVEGYLNRVIYREYQNRQRQRWMTENTSEGEKWKPLNPKYKEAKKKRFASYEGSGERTMVATGTLFKSVIGPGKGHQKVVDRSSLVVSWSTPYAVYTEEVRPVNEWSEENDQKMYDAAAEYLVKAQIRSIFGGSTK